MAIVRLVFHTAVFVLVAPGVVLVALPALILWLSHATAGPPLAVGVGVTILLVGLALFAWCVSDFVARGKGTPDPSRPPTELVVRGPFRLVRNPMYVALAVILAGEALFFLSPWLIAWAVLALLIFHLRVIVYEEPTLARTFGPAWDEYRARVPRWLPRLRVP